MKNWNLSLSCFWALKWNDTLVGVAKLSTNSPKTHYLSLCQRLYLEIINLPKMEVSKGNATLLTQYTKDTLVEIERGSEQKFIITCYKYMFTGSTNP